MEDRVYRDMALFQDRHWWFSARKNILAAVIKNLQLPRNAVILEIGCGTGGNFAMLKQFGQLYAMDSDKHAIAWAAKISDIKIKQGTLPDDLPFYSRKFDLICMFDVLEHIEKDMAAVKTAVKQLKSSGKIIITVPAHMFLFGIHDRNMHHFRRYSKTNLKNLLEDSNLNILKISYFNMMLFPALILARCLDFFRKKQDSIGYDLPGPFLNRIFYKLFTMEEQIINLIDMPTGASLIAVCQKKSQ